MAYDLRLFKTYEPFLLGVEVVFNILKSQATPQSQAVAATAVHSGTALSTCIGCQNEERDARTHTHARTHAHIHHSKKGAGPFATVSVALVYPSAKCQMEVDKIHKLNRPRTKGTSTMTLTLCSNSFPLGTTKPCKTRPPIVLGS